MIERGQIMKSDSVAGLVTDIFSFSDHFQKNLRFSNPSVQSIYIKNCYRGYFWIKIGRVAVKIKAIILYVYFDIVAFAFGLDIKYNACLTNNVSLNYPCTCNISYWYIFLL